MDEILMLEVDLTQMEFLIRMLVAAGIGFVLGLEREFSSLSKNEEIFAGVRTFVVVVLFGFLSTFLAAKGSIWILIVGMVGTIAIVGISYWISGHKGQIGGTTEFATLTAFLLGGSTFLGYIEESLALTVIILVFLSLKVQIQGFIGRITNQEMIAFIKFVILALLILPFLPNQSFGPYGVLNPREVGWIVVLTSGIGFVGFLLVKFLGNDRGILITGILGGLVSSTVVTWVFSKKSKEVPALSSQCAVAILAASTIMVLRVVVWVMIFNKDLINSLILPIALLFVAGIGAAIYFFRKNQNDTHNAAHIPLGEPLDLKAALFFGILYSGVLLLVSFANERFGEKGILISSAIAALTDIDAITISISNLAKSTLSALTAQNAILLAALCNTVIKIGIAIYAGSVELRKLILIGFGLIFLAGIVGFFVLNF